MKSIIFPSKGKVTFIEEDIPDCPSHGLLLKTMFSGLSNGTERNILLGQNYGGTFPAKAGYQLISEVVYCGKDVTNYFPGDIIYNGKFKGHVEYSVVKEGDLFVKLAPGFDLESSALLGVASISHYAVRKTSINKTDNVAIFGAGLIGQFISQVCNNKGAQVTIKDLDEKRLELAKHYVKETEEPYSKVFECSGAEDMLNKIIGTSEEKGLIGKGGKVILIGGRNKVKYDFNSAQQNEVNIIHTNHFDKSDLEKTIREVEEGRINIRYLIKDVVSIDNALQIYENLRDNPLNLMGTIFKW